MGGTSVYKLEGKNDERKDFKYVGVVSQPGRQSWDMAHGVAKYPRDLTKEGMLHAMALRSPYGHAKVEILDTSKAEALEGVELIVTWEDEELSQLPKEVIMYYQLGATPILGNEAEYEGDEVGVVVVARTEEICKKALDLIKVKWTILPHILDPREARQTGAPILLPEMNPDGNLGGNTFGALNIWEDGNVVEGFEEADHILEFDFNWGNWCQFRPMPSAYLAYWEPDPWGNADYGDVCYTTNHQIYPRMGPVACGWLMFGSDEDHMRALSPYMAGRYCDFIEKRGVQLAPFLSKRLGGRPVRYAYSRRAAFDANVPQTYYHVRFGFKNDGTICAVQSHNVHQSGARGGYGAKTDGHLVLPPQASGFRATKCKNIFNEMEQMLTNGTCGSADPGINRFDIVAKAFSMIADELGMDPIDVMMANMHTTRPSLEACVEAGKKEFGWDEKWHAAGTRVLEDGRLHGVAVRPCVSITWGMISYNINLALRPDGKVYMPYQEPLLGTYWPECVQAVIAEEMGMKIEDVIVYYAAHYPNWSQGDAADHAATATWTAKEAAIELKEKIIASGYALLGASSPSEVDIVDSMLVLKKDPSVCMSLRQNLGQIAVGVSEKPSPFDDTYRTLRTMNVDFCEVAVDPETGEVEILDYCMVHDFGKVMRPSSATGQMEMFLGLATGVMLREETIWDKDTGVLLNGNAIDYKVTTRLDCPPLKAVPVETRCGGGAYGATGIGHAHFQRCLVPLAVQNAIGASIDSVPVTNDKVLRALGKIN